jgi:hypothetical protein
MGPIKLKRMPRYPGAKRRKLPDMKGGAPRVAEREPDKLQELTRRLGGRTADYKLAKRILQMQTEGWYQEIPAASIPELVVYCYLTDNKIPFTYQAMLFGGRRAKGGLVPDFVVQSGGLGLAWLIQGEYWHDRSTTHGQKDATNRLRLVGTVYKGVRISGMVELWENDIFRMRPKIFQLALNVIGLRD